MMGRQHSAVVGVVSGRAFFLTILPLALLLPAASVDGQFLSIPLNCHKTCVCASNIVSCSKMNLTVVPLHLPHYTAYLDLSYNTISRLQADWTPVKLSRLHNLLLSHNGLNFLSSEAFVYVTKLRYLDLSSNGLRILEELIFEPLEHLEVLLLYNNQISQIDRTAFTGLHKIQKIYLSQNQISRFPLELVKERNRHGTLTLLDVSSNRIKNLPLGELNALPAWLKNGLFFQNNPLPCTCELYEMVGRWHLQQLGSAVDFRDDHTCLLPGPQKERLVTLDLNRLYLNCSEVSVLDREVYLDQFLILDCDVRQKHMLKRWVLPANIPSNDTAKVLAGGNLQIGPLKAEDSGVYTCYATSDSLNETVYVTVAVHNFTKTGGIESMKTAYTTLVGCLVSVVMILLYLFITPCNCICCPNAGLSKGDPGDSLHSSTVSISQMHDNLGCHEDDGSGGGGGAAKAFLARRVSFMDAKDQLEQNGRLNPIGEEEEEWQGDSRERRKSDAESVSSVSSDTPMVV